MTDDSSSSSLHSLSSNQISKSKTTESRTNISQNSNVDNTNPCQDARQYMISKGYQVGPSAFTKTLQGSIWCGFKDGGFDKKNAIKVTNKELKCNNIAMLNGKRIKTEENIISEMKILKYLTNQGIYFGLNKFIVNYIDFFEDETNYYLVMEHGGSSLFDFVFKAHQCILSRKLDVFEWKNVCRNLFKQMVTFIDILHNYMGVCHLDISLENMLINNVKGTFDDSDNNMINIKFCDFGLSELFDIKANPKYLCNKWVGKIGYQCPEIYEKKANFNAAAAEVWSLGVCLYVLLIGFRPYNKPSMDDDPAFKWIESGDLFMLIELIKRSGKLSHVDAGSLDILCKIFKKENERISIKQLSLHYWLH